LTLPLKVFNFNFKSLAVLLYDLVKHLPELAGNNIKILIN